MANQMDQYLKTLDFVVRPVLIDQTSGQRDTGISRQVGTFMQFVARQ